jgi:small conductance mechanosensitive channel
MLILLRPFKAGDFVQIAGLEGTIEQVRVFQTQMRTIDNRVIVLPNSQITTAPIVNFTARPTRRLDLVVGVGYDDDLSSARTALLDVAHASERVLTEPAADVLVSALGESSVQLTLRAWVPTADILAAKSELLEAMHRELRARGLSIPYPQRDLHVYHHGAPPSAGAAAVRDALDDGDR